MAPCACGEHTAGPPVKAAHHGSRKTPAFRTRRFYRLATPSGATRLGAFTECLHRRIAGSLGRPPRVQVVVLSLPRKGRASTGDLLARKACTRDGSVASRSVPATRPARLLAGAGRAAVNPKRIPRSIVLGKQSGCCCQFLVIRRRGAMRAKSPGNARTCELCSPVIHSCRAAACWSGKPIARIHHPKNPPAAATGAAGFCF